MGVNLITIQTKLIFVKLSTISYSTGVNYFEKVVTRTAEKFVPNIMTDKKWVKLYNWCHIFLKNFYQPTSLKSRSFSNHTIHIKKAESAKLPLFLLFLKQPVVLHRFF